MFDNINGINIDVMKYRRSGSDILHIDILHIDVLILHRSAQLSSAQLLMA